ncbi:MAG: GNAT family N-acetyltransferase [bacterium]|nr:GNAT family N-acetyltransferase [bacterium]
MELKTITEEGMRAVVSWCQNTDAAFLRQWTGKNYEYPITVEKMKTRYAGGARMMQFELNGEIVGTIEILRENEDTKAAYVGCFLMNPALCGKGLGTEAIQMVKTYCKENGYQAVELSVYDYNTGALKCYQKAGFVTYDEQDCGDCKALYMRA